MFMISDWQTPLVFVTSLNVHHHHHLECMDPWTETSLNDLF